jgi:hypothetical protein
MILSHKNNLIFIKTIKTAGTSFEMALSAFCGDQDVISPILLNNDEQRRYEIAGRGAQNYRHRWSDVLAERGVTGFLRFLRKKEYKRQFYHHMTAHEIRARVGAEIFDNYKKVAIVRNPYDRMISSYFWGKSTGSDVPFDRFLLGRPDRIIANHRITQIDGVETIDKWLRFEHLQQDIAGLEQDVPQLSGLYDLFSKINSKGGLRPAKAGMDEMYAGRPDLIELIRILERETIEKFGYELPNA